MYEEETKKFYTYHQHPDDLSNVKVSDLYQELKVRYNGILFSGLMTDLKCKYVKGKCITSGYALIPDGSFKIGMKYDLKFGDPLMIEGLVYLGESKINLPEPKDSSSEFYAFLNNSYFVFGKGEDRVYIHTSYSSYEIKYSSLLLRIWKLATK